jgi:hypothetical protein
MSGMVMLIRGWQRIVAVLTALTALGRFVGGVLAASPPDDDEAGESERAATIYAQSAKQAPAPSMPIGNRIISAWQEEEPYYHHSWTWRGSPVPVTLGAA